MYTGQDGYDGVLQRCIQTLSGCRCRLVAGVLYNIQHANHVTGPGKLNQDAASPQRAGAQSLAKAGKNKTDMPTQRLGW